MLICKCEIFIKVGNGASLERTDELARVMHWLPLAFSQGVWKFARPKASINSYIKNGLKMSLFMYIATEGSLCSAKILENTSFTWKCWLKLYGG